MWHLYMRCFTEGPEICIPESEEVRCGRCDKVLLLIGGALLVARELNP